MPFDPSWTNLLSKSLQFLKHEKSLNKFTITIRKSKTPLLPDSYSREGKFVETLRKMSRRKHHRGLMESVSERWREVLSEGGGGGNPAGKVYRREKGEPRGKRDCWLDSLRSVHDPLAPCVLASPPNILAILLHFSPPKLPPDPLSVCVSTKNSFIYIYNQRRVCWPVRNESEVDESIRDKSAAASNRKISRRGRKSMSCKFEERQSCCTFLNRFVRAQGQDGRVLLFADPCVDRAHEPGSSKRVEHPSDREITGRGGGRGLERDRLQGRGEAGPGNWIRQKQSGARLEELFEADGRGRGTRSRYRFHGGGEGWNDGEQYPMAGGSLRSPQVVQGAWKTRQGLQERVGILPRVAPWWKAVGRQEWVKREEDCVLLVVIVRGHLCCFHYCFFSSFFRKFVAGRRQAEAGM